MGGFSRTHPHSQTRVTPRLGGEHLHGRIAHARTETLGPTVQENANALFRALERVRATFIGRTAANKVDVAAADAVGKGIKLGVVAVVVQINVNGNGVARRGRGVASLHYEISESIGLLKEFTPWMLALRIGWRL